MFLTNSRSTLHQRGEIERFGLDAPVGAFVHEIGESQESPRATGMWRGK